MKTLLFTAILLLILSTPAFSASIVRYVNTAADPSGDGVDNTVDDTGGDGHWAYDSLSNWESNENADLTDNGGDTMTVICMGTAADTTSVDILGWDTDTTNTITIKTDSAESNSRNLTSTWSTSTYQLAIASATTALDIREDYVTVDGLQISTETNGNDGCIATNSTSNTAAILNIKNCRLTHTALVGSNNAGIRFNSGVTVNIENTIVYGCEDNGIWLRNISSLTVTADNTVVYGTNGSGFKRTSSGTFHCTNCLSFENSSSDFSGTIVTIEYCASDDGDDTGSNGVTIDSGDALNDYPLLVKDALNGDFTPTDGDSDLVGAGDGTGPATDIIEVTWVTDEIGAFAYIAAGGDPRRIMLISQYVNDLIKYYSYN